MGFDTICVKRAEGIYKWYRTPAQLRIEKAAVEAVGVKYRAFHYIYGPAFGNDQIITEAAILKEIGSVCGISIADMEVQWNGKVAAANALAKLMANRPAPFIVSTWADPVQQNWVDVIKCLDPVVDAWGPQQYTAWLSGQEQFQWTAEKDRIMPEIDITSVFTNSPLAVLKDAIARGHRSIWIWEYLQALRQPNLVRQMLAMMAPQLTTAKPVKLPAPEHKLSPIIYRKYTVVPGDTLSEIASKLHLHNWFQDLYILNKNILDQAAQRRGQHDSRSGALIYPGTVLQYRAL